MTEPTEPQRPEAATDDVLAYLDILRESANPMAAKPYLMRDMDMTAEDAQAALGYWMATYRQRHPKTEQQP